jgi:hypothetical protein
MDKDFAGPKQNHFCSAVTFHCFYRVFLAFASLLAMRRFDEEGWLQVFCIRPDGER